MKQYVMTVGGTSSPDDRLLDVARGTAGEVLPRSGGGGCGFVLVHHARPANFVLVDWWEHGVDLRQRYYRSSLDRPEDLEELGPPWLGCVWELEVLLHERDSWAQHVLQQDPVDYDAYLADQAEAH